MLRPVVRLLLSHGVTYPQLAEALKAVFVRAALESTTAPARMTDSTIAVATGIHRKDVKRLRSETPQPEASKADGRQSLASTVFTHWLVTPQYCDANGKPLPLTRQGDGKLSFERLVKTISTDVHPRTVLNELQRLQLVDTDADSVRLKVDSFVPNADFAQLIDYLASNLHDHAAAAVSNVLGARGPFLEQSVFSSDVAYGTVDELAGAAREQWSAVVKKMVPEIARREVVGSGDVADSGNSAAQGGATRADPAGPSPEKARIRLGMYFFAERAPAVGKPASDDGKQT